MQAQIDLVELAFPEGARRLRIGDGGTRAVVSTGCWPLLCHGVPVLMSLDVPE